MRESTPAEHFDALFRADPDPWGHQSVPHEVRKYAATLDALTGRHYARGLEVGCGIGVMTALLADHCGELVAIDHSAEAVALTRARTAMHENVRVHRMRVPAEYPDGGFDLTVVSEVGYYLSTADLGRLVEVVAAGLLPGGVLILVHFTPRLPDLELCGPDVHRIFLERGRRLGLRHVRADHGDNYVLDRLERVPAAGPDGGWALIDGPVEGTTVTRSPVVVWGWALPPSGAVATVTISVDGAPAGRARLGLPRPGLVPGDAAGGLAGFECLVDLSACAGSAVAIGASVVGLGGETAALGPVTVALRDRDAEPDAVGSDPATSPPPAALPRRPPDPPRVLVVTHSLAVGGAELWLVELLTRLVSGGAAACTLIAPADGALRGRTEELGVPVHVAGPVPDHDPVAYRGWMEELHGWSRGCRPDLVLANTLLSHSGVELARRLGRPAIWAVHEGLPLDHFVVQCGGAERPMLRAGIVSGLRHAAAVTFDSEAGRAMFAGHGDASRHHTIPYGVDTAAIAGWAARHPAAGLRRDLGLPAGATVLLWMGTFTPRKAQSLLLQAFARVSAERDEHLHLVLVGDAGGAYSAGVHAHVEAAGIAGRVRIVPVIDDPYPWYAVADLFVCPSDEESMPRSVIEAMAFGVPVLSTGVAGLSELVEDSVTGWVFAERDLGALIAGLRRVLDLPAERRAAVADAGRRNVRERHDGAGYATAYARLIAGLAERPDARPGELLSGPAAAR